MVKLHAASMFIKDPVDVWGKEKNIGLAEHSARRLAPPITSLVEQGNLIYYDGYESGVQKYELHQVLGGTANRSADYTYSESFSLKCSPTGGAGSQGGARYYITDFHEALLSAKATITSPNHTGWYFYASIRYYDGTSLHSAVIRYSASGSVDYYSSAGVWTSLISIPRYGNEYNWGSISLAVDLSTQKYSTARIYRDEIDMSAYAMRTVADATSAHIEIALYFEDIAGTAPIGYIDDFVVMENV